MAVILPKRGKNEQIMHGYGFNNIGGRNWTEILNFDIARERCNGILTLPPVFNVFHWAVYRQFQWHLDTL